MHLKSMESLLVNLVVEFEIRNGWHVSLLLLLHLKSMESLLVNLVVELDKKWPTRQSSSSSLEVHGKSTSQPCC